MAAAGVEGAAAAADAMLATRTAKVDVDPDIAARTVGRRGRRRWGSPPTRSTPSLGRPQPTLGDDSTAVGADPRPATPASWSTSRSAPASSPPGSANAWPTSTRPAPATRSPRSSPPTCPPASPPAASNRSPRWVLAQPELVPIPAPARTTSEQAGWEQRWTSHRLLTIETEIMEALDDPRRHPRSHVATAQPATSSDGDRRVRHARRRSGRRRAQDLPPTAGPSRCSSAGPGPARPTPWPPSAPPRTTAAGTGMIGVAPSARAARELADGAGIEAFTFPRFQLHVAADTRPPTTSSSSTKPAMAGTVDLHRVITQRPPRRRPGDPRRRPPPAPRDRRRRRLRRRRRRPRRPTSPSSPINRRQSAEWEHAALDQLRHGNPLAGFRAYHEHGHVTVAATAAEVHTAAVDAWADAHRAGVDGILLAGTRSEASALNRLARAPRRRRTLRAACWRSAAASSRPVTASCCCATATAPRRPPSTSTGATDPGRQRHDRHHPRASTRDGSHRHPARQRPPICASPPTTCGPATSTTATPPPSTKPKASPATACSSSDPPASTAKPSTSPCPAPATAPTCTPPPPRSPNSSNAPTPPASPSPAEHVDELDHDVRQAVDTVPGQSARPHPRPAPADHRQRRRRVPPRLAVGPPRRSCRHAAAELVADRLHRPHRRPHSASSGPAPTASSSPPAHGSTPPTGTTSAPSSPSSTAPAPPSSSSPPPTADARAARSSTGPTSDPSTTPNPSTSPPTPTPTSPSPKPPSTNTPPTGTTALHAHGIHPDELHIIPAAIAMRRQRLAHPLAGDPPAWLTCWYGPRPADPAGAQVWDDEIAQLAAWRDARHLDPDTPGYGPQPDDPRHAARWAEHLDRSLATRDWLHQHSPTLPPPDPQPVDIAAVRERLAELDRSSPPPHPTRPASSTPSTTANSPPPTSTKPSSTAADTQDARRQWILEHWPHVVEHAELTRISNTHDPLAHWPDPPSPEVLELHRQLAGDHRRHPRNRHPPRARRTHRRRPPPRHPTTPRNSNTPTSSPASTISTPPHPTPTTPKQPCSPNTANGSPPDSPTSTARSAATAPTPPCGTSDGDPRHIQDAITRRANHLAHHAITTDQPWVYNAIADWHDDPPPRHRPPNYAS